MVFFFLFDRNFGGGQYHIHNYVHMQAQLLHPQSKLEWKRCADMPVKMFRAQAVAIGNEIYLGGGVNTAETGQTAILMYNTVEDEWTRLSNHCVRYFGLCGFQGELLTVGGASGGLPTNKVFHYIKEDRKWAESLKPMPTMRVSPAVLTTASAIVVCGGLVEGENGEPVVTATVEVYSSTTSQWYTADPLPQPCAGMSSITISGCSFLLGGTNDHKPIRSSFCVDISTLIGRANIIHRGTTSWKTLPDTPLAMSTAATLSGRLLAVGGKEENGPVQSSVYMFVPPTNSWVKLSSGDLPVKRYSTTTVQLSNNRVMVMGGLDNNDRDTSTCYIGSVVV